MAEIEDNTKKWKDTPCLWIRKIKSILLKKKKLPTGIYRLNVQRYLAITILGINPKELKIYRYMKTFTWCLEQLCL